MKMNNSFTKALIFALAAIFLFNCNGGNNSSYAHHKMSMEDKEKAYPSEFLTADGNYRKNIWGEFVLEGYVFNHASVVTYKDVIIEVKFYSKTLSVIATERKPIYEYFPPNHPEYFKIKLTGPRETNSIKLKVVTASSI